MTDPQCVSFLQWALPRLRLRWPGFRKVRRQIHKRLNRRMAELGLAEISEYQSYLDAHAAEWTVLDGLCRISISRFYRDRGVFDYLGEKILPELARAAIGHGESQLRIWCAGCASGEEPYTFSILWRLGVAPDFPGVRLHLTATDADEQLLGRARAARYPASSLKDVPPDWLPAAFTESEGEYSLRPPFGSDVAFLQQDIREQMPDGPFDLVACRHLAFTYFAEDLQRTILRRIMARVRPDGILVAGKQEPLPEGVARLSAIGRNLGIYRVFADRQVSDGRCSQGGA